MKNNSFLIKVWALAVSSVVMVSCEVMDDYMHVDSNVIKFSVDATADGAPSTRATQYADSPVVMLGEGGSDTLYLHASIDANTATVSKEAMAGTRGVPVTSDNFRRVCENFSVTAYTEDGKLYMSNEKVDGYANGAWSPSGGARYWPEDETLDFYAYAPYSFKDNKQFDNGALTIDKTDHTMSFSYTVPTTTDGNDAVAQPDIMFAYAACSRSTTNERGNVPLEFAHALAAVKFVANDIAGCTINSITLKGLYGAGDCVYDCEKDEFTWKLIEDKDKSFTQKFDVKLNDQQTGEQDITDKKPETTFMLIPQQLDGATVEVSLTTNDGDKHTLEGKLDSGLKEWQAGNIYTYKISSESINWEYVFEVTPTITFELGETHKTYSVKSYRYRAQNPSIQEPVAWTATRTKATQTNFEDNNTTDLSGNVAVTEFTDEDVTGSITEKSYDMLVERTQMHTSYEGDKNLRLDSNVKGNENNPYDLSLVNGKRTTANCYVVNGAGTYKLPLVYGNGIVNDNTNRSAFHSDFKDYQGKSLSPGTDPWITHHYKPNDCILVWSDGFYMFENVHLDGDYLVFSLNKEYMQQANAILAVRDAHGRIMWSWHIWVTEHDIYNENVYGLQDWDDNTISYQLMGWNLGWVDGKFVYYNQRDWEYQFVQAKSGKDATLKAQQKGDKFDYRDVGSTYYQWGRKDPIVALRNRDAVGRDDYRPQETIDKKYKYDLATGPTTISQSIQNPNIYYTMSSSNAWLNSSDFTYRLWDTGSPTNADSKTSTKTIYDPSPRGYKIPPSRAFLVFVNGNNTGAGGTLNGSMINAYQYDVFTHKNGGQKLTLTSTGQRADRDGILEVVTGGGLSEIGGLWAMDGVYHMTCKVSGNATTVSYVLCIRKPAGVFASQFLGAQTMARPVRCIKE